MKRRAKAVEELAEELVALRDRDLAKLPCEAALREEIRQARNLKGGARQRQVKYITKILREEPREEPREELLSFLQEKKGSGLARAREQHEAEHARDLLINEAIRLFEAPMFRKTLLEPGQGAPEQPPLAAGMREEVQDGFPGADADELWSLAWQFARSRRINYSREIFRILKAAMDRQRFGGKAEG